MKLAFTQPGAGGCFGPSLIRFGALWLALAVAATARDVAPAPGGGAYHFDRTISREVLENYLSRAITMEGLLNGRGDLDDNIRMLKSVGAKFIGRALCLWGGGKTA